jgi:NAD(P)-dependent dehydrogenase (short-subunit alcohol dehydrogenase family)
MQSVKESAMALEGSKVVIVGGSSGIGLGAAEAIAERGADVILVGRSVDKLHRAARVLDAPQHVSTISADVTVEADVQRMFSQVGSFDHLVVTRGAPPPGAPIESTDLRTVRAFIDVMLVSAFSLAKHARGKLRPGGVDTPMWDEIAGNAKQEIWAQMASRLPARRIGTVADLAKAYVFVLESEFTTGTVLEVDGGHALI